MAADLKTIVNRMIAAGESEETIGQYIKEHQTRQGGVTPVASDNEKQAAERAFKGTTSTIMQGIRENLVPGVGHGIYEAGKGLLKLPGAAIDAVMSPVETGSKIIGAIPGAVDSLKQWPQNIVDDVKAGARDPKTYGRMMGSKLGEGAGGALLGEAVPLVPMKGAIRTVGKGLQYAGEHPFASHLASGASIVGGIYKMDPELVGAGVAGTMVPPVLAKAGRAIRIATGESPAVVKLGEKGVSKLNDAFDHAMAGRNVAFADEQAATAAAAAKETAKVEANAARLQKIENAKAGRTAGKPAISESVSAELPDGGRTSMSTRFTEPETAKSVGAGGPTSPNPPSGLSEIEQSLLDQGLDPKLANRVYEKKQGAFVREPQAAVVAPDVPAAKTPSPFEDYKASQLERDMMERDALRGTPEDVAHSPVAQETEAARVAASAPVEEPILPRSKSSRRSGGDLSPNDLDALKKYLLENPDAPPEDIAQHLSEQRLNRSASYRINGGLDKGARIAQELEK